MDNLPRFKRSYRRMSDEFLSLIVAVVPDELRCELESKYAPECGVGVMVLALAYDLDPDLVAELLLPEKSAVVRDMARRWKLRSRRAARHFVGVK